MQLAMDFRTISLVAVLGGLLLGYDTGVISHASRSIGHSFALAQGLQGYLPGNRPQYP